MVSQADSPLFVVGTSRSGTTLLYAILLSSGEFPLYEAETLLLEECATKYGNLNREKNYAKFMEDWLRSKQFSRSGLEAESFKNEARAHAGSYIEFLSFFMESMAKRQGKRRWAEKTPAHIKHMGELSRVFKNSKFIHIIRDGRDVAISRRKLGWIGTRSKEPLKQLLFSAVDWEITVNNGRSLGNQLGSHYLEVRYEDIISDVGHVLIKVNDFADIKIDKSEMKDVAIGSLKRANTAFGDTMDGISNKAVERWKKSLTEKELVCLNIAIGKTLRKLGYKLSEIEGGNGIGLYLKVQYLKLFYTVSIYIKRFIKRKLGVGRFLPTGLEIAQNK